MCHFIVYLGIFIFVSLCLFYVLSLGVINHDYLRVYTTASSQHYICLAYDNAARPHGGFELMTQPKVGYAYGMMALSILYL